METAELALAIKLASPCIVNSNYLPILCHYCFTGNEVYAYDDVSAIVVGLKTGLKCGLRGEILSRIVECCGSKVTLKQDGGDVILTSGASTSRLPIQDPREFVFKEEADEQYKIKFALTAEAQTALGLAVASVSKDVLLHREWTAVMLRIGDPLRFYATDGVGLVRIDSDAAVKGVKPRSVLIPESVCSQITSIASALSLDPEDVKVSIGTDHLRVDFEKDGAMPVRIIGKLVPEKAPDYEQMIEDLNMTAKAFPIPDDFYRAVAKVAAVTSSDMEPKCVLETGAEFVVSGEGTLGSARTVFELPKPMKKARAVVHPERLKRYQGLLTTIAVEPEHQNSHGGIAMHGEGIDYFTSCYEEQEGA